MTQISAQLNYLRIAPRKVRAVADLIRGQDLDAAQSQLKYLTKRSARPLIKLLDSAAANAWNNLGLDKSYLYIKEITVNEGPKLKRFKPKGFGMVMPIQKKTSHIKVVLAELPDEKKRKKELFLAKLPKIEVSAGKAAETKKRKEVKAEHKPRAEKEIQKGVKKGGFGGIRSLGRKIFRRKSI